MAEAFCWYLATLAIGGAGLLPAAVLFPTLRSRGVFYARPLALVLLSIGAWWLGWSGVIPYGLGALGLVLVALWISTVIVAMRRPDLLRSVVSRWRLMLVGEVVFIVVFALVALARAQAPNAAATEKPMDLLMLTAVHRAEVLPPPDPWLSGEAVSYYHLGHLTTDAVGQLSGNGPEIGFNLGIAMVGALAGTAMFGLAGDVFALSPARRRGSRWVAGIAGLLALLWVAPLASHFDIAKILVDGDSPLLEDWWWWWGATRVLPKPITEFPAFSLLLGDLHAHVLALPASLLAIAIAVTTFQGQLALTWRSWLKDPARLGLSGAVFAALFMTNSWDVLTFGPLWFGAVVLAYRRVGWDWVLALFSGVRYLALPIGAALVLAAPFIANLDSTTRSVTLVSVEASDPGNWLLIWLVPLLPLLLGAFLLRAGGARSPALIGGLTAGGAIGVWAVLQVASGHVSALGERGSGWVVLVGLAALIGLGVAAIVRAEGERDLARAAWFALGVGAAVIMLATELVNIETETAGRFNTVFKLWYHLWTIIALAGAVALAMVVDRVRWRSLVAGWRHPAAIAAAPALALVAGVLVYLGAFVYAPAMALSRANEGQAPGLDALVYLERSDPGLAGAIEFASTELDPREHVLLQAVSEAYGSGGYLAAASGVPTVLNWPWHQIQWRGSDDQIEGRREAVELIYIQGAEAEQTAAQFGVTHVYVGREERRQFGDDVADRFAGWSVAWEGAGALIFEAPDRSDVVASQ